MVASLLNVGTEWLRRYVPAMLCPVHPEWESARIDIAFGEYEPPSLTAGTAVEYTISASSVAA